MADSKLLNDQPNVTAYQCTAATDRFRVGKEGVLRTKVSATHLGQVAWLDIGWAIYARVGLITANIDQVPSFTHK